MSQNKLPHILLGANWHESKNFTSTKQTGPSKNIPQRDRQSHATYLKTRLAQSWLDADSEFVATHADRHGVYLEFKGSPGYELVTKSLEDMRSKKIRLCNVRIEKEVIRNTITNRDEELPVTYATVFVSNNKRQAFFEKIEKYANENTDKGNPKHADLINGIADLRKALLIESFWQDDRNLIPQDNPEWCEVWLSGDDVEIINRFENLLTQQNINAKSGVIRFPERTVKLVHVTHIQLEMLSKLSDDIAEYRKAKNTAAFWTELSNQDQSDWVNDLTERLQIDSESQTSICILDTGVNNGHPLLSPLLIAEDCQSVDPSWGTNDHANHGTRMAGLAAYGSLSDLLAGTGQHTQKHQLESVKILPPNGQNDIELWGDITSQGISRAEIQSPNQKRVCCMAISSEDTRDRGRPSSWSGALDQIISGAEDNTKRLIIVSAGNISDFNQISNYPDTQITDSIHDPAQSWNALTVGAYTKLNIITDPTLNGYRPLALQNELSPFSTTSSTWEDKWPIKPDIVMEGGNVAVDSLGFPTECADLALLTTNYKPHDRLFEYFNMTSAATAQAAWLAAQIQAQYPECWPETIRALMVHSAEWPEILKRQFAQNDSKTELKKLLRICGYGVPNLERALYSASNSLTLISQAEIQPFEHRDNANRTKDMHLYELPWPRDILLGLPDNTPVQMRITLSYFIEPGPGEVGWKDRYRYASHALRFDINSPGEIKEQFVQRINAAAREEDEGHPGTSSASNHWLLGSQARDKGSIHSDIWQGTAQELAASNIIAVSPRIGWWRERSYLGKCEKSTRYALVVSISTPEQEVDVYTPVAQQIGIIIPISV
ncbi:MAG: peptidase S8 [Candidatus Margulisiibacteriota bacterium]|nr:MAG: peptidase S8 [Candidatus Margulisiibacteriota bacterium]HCT86347.1 peptidase S8 [Candidatus Margulisiibacteriota bacterium]